MTIHYEQIPQELKELPNWVCWALETRDGKTTKIPYTPETGQKARANNPKTWTGFKEAAECLVSYDGIGFQFGESPFVGIDLDHCLKGGTVSPEAQQIIDALDSYTEISPSGEGLHIIVRADIAGSGHRNDIVEIYPQGRFFTMTGNVFQGRSAITERTAEVAALIQSIEAERAAKRGAAAPPPVDISAQIVQAAEAPADVLKLVHVIEKSTKSGPYWRGEVTYSSQSEADMALMDHLRFYAGGDKDMMISLFKLSPLGARLDRKKGHIEDYLVRTAEKSLKDWDGKTYDPVAYKMKKGILPDLKFPVTEITIDAKGNEKERPIKDHWKNTAYLLDRLGVQVRLNLLTKNIYITGGGLDGLSLDSAATDLRGTFHQNGLKIGRQSMFDNLGTIADKNRYSPVCEYLQQCRREWDGKDHIDELFNLFELDPQALQDTEFCKLLVYRWLLSCVVLAFNEGRESADGVLILIGPQGVGKTRFLYTLVPNPEWAADGLALDPSVKDDKITAMRFWIVELGEFGDTLKKEKLDRLKAYFTQRTDELRKPYKRASESFPRRTVFLATTNSRRFLKDETGERRYWPISVVQVRNDAAFNINQLWGQVMYLAFELKETHHLNAAEREQLAKHNQPYKNLTAEAELLLDRLDWDAPHGRWVKRTPSDLCEALRLPQGRNRMVGKALRLLAAQDERIQLPTNNHGRLYTVPPIKSYAPAYEDSFVTSEDKGGTCTGHVKKILKWRN